MYHDRPGKGNSDSHDTPAQPEEARVVIPPFFLQLESQMCEKGNGQIIRHEQGINKGQRIGLKNREGGMWRPRDKRVDKTKEGLVMQEWKNKTP